LTKADGEGSGRAEAAAAQYQGALNILAPATAGWTTPVLTVSGMSDLGLDRLWDTIREHGRLGAASGETRRRRERQQVKWMYALIEERLTAPLRTDAKIRARLARLEKEVAASRLLPDEAADTIAAMLGAG
jgi:LAO/AO transport system kinase